MSPQRRRVDVAELVAQTVRDSDLLAGREVKVEADRVIANVDPAKVERIVEEPHRQRRPPHAPGHPNLDPGQRARRRGAIAVDDAGPGVTDELKEAVFEPFRRADLTPSPSPGVGIGLSLVARFAELHGGRAWVEDRTGGGSSFRVFLPDAP